MSSVLWQCTIDEDQASYTRGPSVLSPLTSLPVNFSFCATFLNDAASKMLAHISMPLFAQVRRTYCQSCSADDSPVRIANGSVSAIQYHQYPAESGDVPSQEPDRFATFRRRHELRRAPNSQSCLGPLASSWRSSLNTIKSTRRKKS